MAYSHRKISFFEQFKLGIKNVLSAFSFVFSKGAYWMFLIPAAISLLVSGLVFFGGYNLLPELRNLVIELLPFDQWEWSWGKRIESFLGSLALIAASLLSVFLYISVYKYILLVLLSPLLAYISERTEELETGASYPFSWPQLFKDAWRGIKLSTVNFLKEISLVAILFLIGLIPGVAVITTPIIFIIQAYFVGFSMSDYFLERRRLTAYQSRKTLNGLRGLSIATGVIFNALLFVPVIGVLLGPPLAVIAATRSLIKLETNSPNLQAN